MLIAVGLTVYLLRNDHGEKESIAALWISAGFGVVGAVLAAILEKKLIPVNDLKVGMPMNGQFLSCLGVGLIEESCKFIPLAVFIYQKRYFNEHTDGIIYFALVGLGFGLPENILYTIQYGTSTGLERLVLTPIFHAAITGMVGYYLARSKLSRKNVFLLVTPALLIAAILHAIYDFGLINTNPYLQFVSVGVTVILSINFFYLFMKAGDYDQQLGLSRVGNNSYCRSCGFANPNHNLYCIHCGMHA